MANEDKVFAFKYENKLFTAKKEQSGIQYQITFEDGSTGSMKTFKPWARAMHLPFIQSSEEYTAYLIHPIFEKDLTIDQSSAKDLLPKSN